MCQTLSVKLEALDIEARVDGAGLEQSEWALDDCWKRVMKRIGRPTSKKKQSSDEMRRKCKCEAQSKKRCPC